MAKIRFSEFSAKNNCCPIVLENLYLEEIMKNGFLRWDGSHNKTEHCATKQPVILIKQDAHD